MYWAFTEKKRTYTDDSKLIYHVFCNTQDVNFIRNYSKPPTILLTGTHSSSVGSVAAECNGILSWIEVFLRET